MYDAHYAYSAFVFAFIGFNNLEKYAILAEEELPDSDSIETSVFSRDWTTVWQQ